jgi:hypothetical protein
LSRATFMPALISFSIIPADPVAGPIVQTILVRRPYSLDRLMVFIPRLAGLMPYILTWHTTQSKR